MEGLFLLLKIQTRSTIRTARLSLLSYLRFYHGKNSTVKMATKLNPIDVWSDPRVEHKTASINGQTYKYLLGVPKDAKFRATVFLVCIVSLFNAYVSD